MISPANDEVIVFNGRVAGTWKRSFKKDVVEVMLSPFRKLTKVEMDVP